MFNLSDEKLQEIKAFHTVREIQSQPELWGEVLDLYTNQKNNIEKFLDKILKIHGKVKVVFTGAGTSAYVGDVLYPHLLTKGKDKYQFESIATTDIVSNPREYLEDVPTLLVSFARSGNSPESIQAVRLANQVLSNVYHLAITCASEGKLAINLKDMENAYVLLMPDKSNDKAFAMTSSYTCMTLSALLIFDDKKLDEKTKLVKLVSNMGKNVIERAGEIAKLVEEEFNRVVYLGSGVFKGLTREAQLKILELTAGKIATCFDSSMGFRHGPKSFVDDKTLVFCFISNNAYTRKYDLDIVNEIFQDKVAKNIVAITKNELMGDFPQFSLSVDDMLDDIYLTLPYIVFAQTIAVLSSLKVKNTPDTPSANGTVNRVVKGVVIHDL